MRKDKITPDEMWNIKADIQEALKHSKSSPETRERLVKLETNQKNLMQEIQEIKKLIGDLTTKVECAFEKKADKSEVEKMQADLGELKKKVWQATAIISVALLFISLFREQIVSIFTK
jgi:seryl-tRNA synthetase